MFTPNYRKLGLENSQQALAHICGFLKKNEKSILKNGLGKYPTATFMFGNYKLTLGENDEQTFEKSRENRKK